MTLTTLPCEMVMGPVEHLGLGGAFIAGYTFDSVNDQFGTIVQVPKTGVLDTFYVRCGTVTVSPVNGIKFIFEDVNTSGYPDKVVDQYRTYTTALVSDTWVTPGLITSDGTDSGTKRSVTRGQYLACVIEQVGFTTGDLFAIAAIDTRSLAEQGRGDFPYRAVVSAAGAYSTRGIEPPLVAIQYSDGTFMHVPGVTLLPISAFGTVALDTAGGQDEAGLRFVPTARMRINSVAARYSAIAGSSVSFVLYDDAGGVVASTAVRLAAEHLGSTTLLHTLHFATPGIVHPGRVYRLVAKAGTTTALTLDYFDSISNAAHSVFADPNWYWTERLDGAGSWTDMTARCPFIGFAVDQIEDGSAITNPRLAGPSPARRSRARAAVVGSIARTTTTIVAATPPPGVRVAGPASPRRRGTATQQGSSRTDAVASGTATPPIRRTGPRPQTRR